MSEAEVYDLIIVGGGPGGLTAGIYAMRAALKTVLVEKGPAGGQIMLSDEVENWPGTERIGGAELSMNMANHAESYGLEVRHQEMVAIEPGLDGHTVRLDSGESIVAHAIILSTGGSPRQLNIPGESEFYGKGVSYCAVCDGFFFRGKTVMVVGGGDSAVEESLYLAKLTQKVYIVHRRDELRASRILQQRAMNDCNIEIVWNSVPVQIHAESGGVERVTLKDTQTGETRDLPVDGVFIFIGFQPNNAVVPAGVKLNAQGYVLTDTKCETAIPGIFAVGDLREKYARQIVTAAADGAVAALAAAHYVETKKAVAADSCQLPAQ
jgi:thioredoxin reductase (NADPH)